MNARRLRREALAHLAIILSGMLLVLLVIDHVNSAMVFIDHRITKGLMGVLCVASILNGAQLLKRPARRRDGAVKKQAAASRQEQKSEPRRPG